MQARRLPIVLTLLPMALLVGLLGAAPAGAVAPTSASCIGQSFSSHAGIVPATGGEERVGGFVSESVRESEVPPGQQVSAVAQRPREDCGL
jgi:hypothetical protein